MKLHEDAMTHRRRRGQALEDTLLEAAWEVLNAGGYAGFSLEAVATRAKTSRPVIARRWSSRAELASAAITRFMATHPIAVGNLGSIRKELTLYLTELSRLRTPLVSLLPGFFAETGASLDSLRSAARQEAGANFGAALREILHRAIRRGEIDPTRLSPRVMSLPLDLMRHELLLTAQPATPAAIAEIIDEIFLPLVRLPKHKMHR
jgi:AcrR family transcriptional regulator